MADTAFAAVQRGLTQRKPAMASPPAADRANPAFSPPMTPEQKGIDESGLSDISVIKPIKASDIPSDLNIPDNYVTHTLQTQKHLPPITMHNLLQNINWISFLALTVTPALAIYGALTVDFNLKTFIWSCLYYQVTGLGITAGYHRLWAHRSYNATVPLQFVLAFAGAGAVQGSIKWWSRGHRAHHRYTDTKLDPYSAHEGFWWAHIGWMILKPRTKIGVADISDLTRNKVVRWQHKNYLFLMVFMGLILPTVVAGLGWGDWKGGFFFAGAARLLFVHHSTFCVNSLAHWLGDAPFDNKHTPRDHFFTALVTFGEGYHNFHHQFPMDFRNAIKWFQYDPTKWFIWFMKLAGLASHLKKFPDNEIRKGQYTMKLQMLALEADKLAWPTSSNHLPVISWDDFQAEAKERSLVVIHGFIHDVSSFLDDHPGGAHLLKRSIGKDATTAFFGGVYDHSNAANNLLAMMRVGILDGGYEVEILKKRYRADSTASSDAGSAMSSASSSTEDLTSLAGSELSVSNLPPPPQRENFNAPLYQPQAQIPDRYTLHVPPSEKLRISRAVPQLRSNFTMNGRDDEEECEDVSMADRIGEIKPLVG